MNPTPPVVAAITAAGSSRRMGKVKALLPWGRSTMLGTIAQTVEVVGIRPAIVICGAHRPEVAAEAGRRGLSVIANDSWQSGRFTSIQAAARCTIAHSVRASLLLWPVDCPAVTASTVHALLDAGAGKANVVPTFENRGGHPVLLAPGTVAAILAAPASSNLRDLLRASRAQTMRVAVEDPAVLGNLNSPKDYEASRPRHREGAAG